MINRKIVKQKDAQGLLRFFVLPIETEQRFVDLIHFVRQEFDCDFEELDKGPGTLVRKGRFGSVELVFVMSDSTGAQFYSVYEKDVKVAEEIADRIESKMEC